MKKILKYILNVALAILCMAPLVTIATSITAMHFVNFKLAKDEDTDVVKEFTKSFRQNFLQSLFLLIVFSVTGVSFVFAWMGQFGNDGPVNTLVIIALSIGTLIYFMLETVSTYLLAKFENPLKKLILLTLFTVGAHIDITFKLAIVESAVFAVPILIYIIDPGTASLTAALIVCFVLLVIFEMLSGKWVEPIFDTLIKSNEKRQQQELEEDKVIEAECENPVETEIEESEIDV